MSLPTAPFFGPEGRRAVTREICAKFEEVTGTTPVLGFDGLLDAGDAIAGTDRISGFMAQHDRREWLFRLDATKDLSWRTRPLPPQRRSKVSFLLNMGFGNGPPLPQPTGQWDVFVNDRLAVSVRVVNHSQLWRRGECTLAFAANRIETARPYESLCLSSAIRDEAFASFGPALLTVPSSWVEGDRPATIRLSARADGATTRWALIAPASNIVDWGDIWAAVSLLTDPHPHVGPYRVCFGDIHTHSGQVLDEHDKGCGRGTREENYEYARGPGGLDFYSLTDHEWQIDPQNTQDFLGLADAHSEDGSFVCLPGFEFTNQLYGHRNVYFRDTGGTVFSTSRGWGHPTMDPEQCHTPHDLWAALEKGGVPFITVPHHPSAIPHPFNLDFHNPKHDRLCEVYSSWGSSEYYGDFPRGLSDRWPRHDVRDALSRGLRFGLIASSDGHDGHPGNAQGLPARHHHIFHFCGSGRAAVLVERLTRHEVFDALHSRRCYATTGVPIVLDFRIGDAVMGTEMAALGAGRRPVLEVSGTGSNGLDHVRIMRNARPVATIPCHGERRVSLQWEDPSYSGDEPASYYVRLVQQDRESAWSSPIWIG